MSSYDWTTSPEPVRRQVDAFALVCRDVLSTDLTGVYLHGSLAMGCFNPICSDLDLLVVVERHMTVEEKSHIARFLLENSGKPSPIEVSFLCMPDLHPWRHPAPYDFHYSEDWRQRYLKDLRDGAWQHWNDERHCDEDLAGHITAIRLRGLRLCGRPIPEVFPPVPREDYVASIVADFEWAISKMDEIPVYAVLNGCRVWIYLADDRVCSKEEGATWAMEHLPESHRKSVSSALTLYRGQTPSHQLDRQRLAEFLDFIKQRICAGLSSHDGSAM